MICETTEYVPKALLRSDYLSVVSDTVVGDNIQEFDYPMEPETCYLFYWGTEEY